MPKALAALSPAERFTLGLDVLLNLGSLAAMSRDTGYSTPELERVRDDFLAAARRGLETNTPGPNVPSDATVREFASGMFELAQGFLDVGRPEDAERCFRRAVALDGREGLFRKGLALFLFGQGRAAEAEPEAEKALSLLGDDAECRAMRAVAFHIQGAHAEAVAELERCMARGGLPDYALRAAVDLAVALGLPGRALALAESAAEAAKGGDDRAALYVLAELHKRQGRFAAAEAVLVHALQRWGAEEPFVLLLGVMECLFLGRPAEGLARLEDWVRENPSSTAALLALGDMFASGQEPTRAEQMYLRVFYRDPADSRAVSALLDLYLRTGEAAKLRYLAGEVLRADPGHSQARFHLVQHLIERGDFEGVDRNIAELRAAAPDGAGLAALSLFAAFERGEPKVVDACERDLHATLAASGAAIDEIGTILTLCRYLRLNGDAARSLRILHSLPEATRAAGGVQLELCLALAETGDPNSARRLLEEAWAREPFDGCHGTRLAAHLVEYHGDPARARDVLAETRRGAYWNDEFALSLAATYALVGALAEGLDVLYAYFVARGRRIPPVAGLPPASPRGADAARLTREQRFALAAAHASSPAGTRRREDCLATLRELARSEAEKAVVAQLAEGRDASAARDGGQR